MLFGASLLAEFIANDRPLLIRYDNAWYVPVLQDYSGDQFGSDFLPTDADYTDPDLRRTIAAKGWMLWPPIHYSYATTVTDLNVPSPAPPSWHNLLGTDDKYPPPWRNVPLAPKCTQSVIVRSFAVVKKWESKRSFFSRSRWQREYVFPRRSLDHTQT